MGQIRIIHWNCATCRCADLGNPDAVWKEEITDKERIKELETALDKIISACNYISASDNCRNIAEKVLSQRYDMNDDGIIVSNKDK